MHSVRFNEKKYQVAIHLFNGVYGSRNTGENGRKGEFLSNGTVLQEVNALGPFSSFA